ncbi:e465f6bd-85a2-471d-99f5-88e507279279 [Sclerotinia trifoliorum]|uniref:E465f6bd-85a2-471d-99f5-88e507279279 n=1 Tax=Sclerotinia trifoliorum TaxID=28548 RepID=A0A8H2VRY1_9HELO|nr:e465f6bd-85a2-471d-99f5-88e507279279 [Sclerotinia trifoliorum]
MDTTRRSSRAARGSQPFPTNSHHSSASSNSSGRAERSTRSNNKVESPRKSTPSASLSSDSPDDATAAEDSSSTRRKRGRADVNDKISKGQPADEDTVIGVDEGGEDDEAVRCICGYDEYPGPPQLEDDDNKNNTKDGIDESVITAADFTEDLAGFFLQCDVCKVWQHGGCVGIMNEDTSPEEYFCEQCRKELHRIRTALNGQRYSLYLPLHPNLSRTTSRAASFSKDGTRSPKGGKNGRPTSSSTSAKRRSTMNSRDAAYDAAAEAEQIRQAIAASVAENNSESADGRSRKAKRSRSYSEDSKHEGPKRQRTDSASPTPEDEEKPQEPLQRSVSQAESDDSAIIGNGRFGAAKKIRGAAAKNHREKELREERERSRLEAANKRKGRAERRRIEDSEPIEETPPAIKPPSKNSEVATQPPDPPPASQAIAPDTPPPVLPPVSHKKGGRPPNPRKGKSGKNQYTKDKDDNSVRSPNRSQSRDISRTDDNGHMTNSKGSNNESKSNKAKASVGSKISMVEMRKRAASILDFISRTQIELAGDPSMLPSGSGAEKYIRGLVEETLPMIRLNGVNGADGKQAAAGESHSPKEFKDLTCLEMMDILTRQLVKWQKEYA